EAERNQEVAEQRNGIVDVLARVAPAASDVAGFDTGKDARQDVGAAMEDGEPVETKRAENGAGHDPRGTNIESGKQDAAWNQQPVANERAVGHSERDRFTQILRGVAVVRDLQPAQHAGRDVEGRTGEARPECSRFEPHAPSARRAVDPRVNPTTHSMPPAT